MHEVPVTVHVKVVGTAATFDVEYPQETLIRDIIKSIASRLELDHRNWRCFTGNGTKFPKQLDSGKRLMDITGENELSMFMAPVIMYG